MDPRLKAFLKEKKDVMSRYPSSSSSKPLSQPLTPLEKKQPHPPSSVHEEEIQDYVQRNTFGVIFQILYEVLLTPIHAIRRFFK